MNKTNEILKNFDYLTPSIAKENGVSKWNFYQYVNDSGIDQLYRGFYSNKDTWVDNLYVLHQRCPKAVFSHDEAFYYHDLCDREPIVNTLTIYSGYNAHRLKASMNCKVYTVKKELLDVGKIMVTDNYGNQVPMYNLERTIIDLFRSRNSIEINEFVTVLKSYARKKDKNLRLLMEYAELFNVDNIVRQYMEVLL